MAKLKILVVQGANMNWLGIRQPEIYGTTTAAELDEQIRQYATDKGFEVDIFYSNSEAETIDKLYEAHNQDVDAIVMNPGGFTHAGYALKDAILGIKVPCVEVHISNHFLRGIHSVLGVASKGVIMGFGLHGYFLGIDAALHLVAQGKG